MTEKPATTTPRRLRACEDARQWAEGFSSPEEAWKACTNPVWLIWSITNTALEDPRHSHVLLRLAHRLPGECIRTWPERYPDRPRIPSILRRAFKIIDTQFRCLLPCRVDYDTILKSLRKRAGRRRKEIRIAWLCLHVVRAYISVPRDPLTMYTCLMDAIRLYLDLSFETPESLCNTIRDFAGKCHF